MVLILSQSLNHLSEYISGRIPHAGQRFAGVFAGEYLKSACGTITQFDTCNTINPASNNIMENKYGATPYFRCI